MQNKYSYTSSEQLPLVLRAEEVAAIMGISRASAYALMHTQDFPTITIGRRMLVSKERLLKWIDEQAAAEQQDR